MPVVVAQSLRKAFSERVAVADVSFSIEKGEVVALLGPNGAGKSTTMRILTTALVPDRGTAEIAGFDILRNPHEVRRAIGFMPENPPLYSEMRVEEFLRFSGRLRGLKGANLTIRLNQVIEQCSIGDVRRRLCGVLSKGFKQRVGLAQALIHQPEVLILDEPTSGLDPVQIAEVRKLISGLAGTHTILLCTHILPEVVQLCPRVVMIAAGKVVLDGAIATLTAASSLEEKFIEAINTEAA